MNDLAAWLDPARTALVIVDVQVDFASPDGAMALSGADLSAVPAALAAVERLAEAARAAGVLIAFTRLETRPETDSPIWAEQVRRRGGRSDVEAAVCRAGSPGADFHGPAPKDGDLIVAKRRYSAFFETNLDQTLRARGRDTLLVCGLTTECCVDCTVRSAFHLDYHVFVAADACAAYERQLHLAALRNMELSFAIPVQAGQATEAWRN